MWHVSASFRISELFGTKVSQNPWHKKGGFKKLCDEKKKIRKETLHGVDMRQFGWYVGCLN